MSTPNFKHILVATDFGEPSERALQAAIGLAEKLGHPALTLLHVHYIPRPMYDIAVVWPAEELATSAQKALDTVAERAKRQYPKCQAMLVSGAPAERIVQIAAQRNADLVVIGTHGRSGLPRMLLGSVAEAVSRTSPVPVLIVPDKDPRTAGREVELARA